MTPGDVTPLQMAKQAVAVLERAQYGRADEGELERARGWLLAAAGAIHVARITYDDEAPDTVAPTSFWPPQ